MPDGSPFDALPGGLPPGRLITPDPDFAGGAWAGRPVLWASDEPLADAGEQWRRLFDLHATTGLYPLLLVDSLPGHPDGPWRAGELRPALVGTIDVLTADGVLRRFWDSVTGDSGEDPAEPAEDGVPTVRWSGLAPPGVAERDPDAAARDLAESFCDEEIWLLGLVPAARGADTLTLSGWTGPREHTDQTQEVSAVVRSWEDRFGARVVSVGVGTLDLSVAAPPTTPQHARQVAAEHHAFCPDNIWQGGGSFDAYASELIGAERWSFWWA